MLSYRHAFHAGNFADVLKHAVLVALVQSLQRKEKPFFYLDTHAGLGRYDLNAAVAEKTGEWRHGIGLLLEKKEKGPVLLRNYLNVVKGLNHKGPLRYYPGSPRLVRELLRPQDRMWLCELHPKDIEGLRREFDQDRQVKVAFENGFQAVKALLPPKERRGLVLFDPSYEVKGDYRTVVEVMMQGYQRFATGQFAIWYPVVDRGAVDRLCKAVAKSGVARALRVEQCIAIDGSGGMTGSGMIVVNPPWQLDEQMAELLPWLTTVLAPAGGGSFQLEWLAGQA